MPVLILKRRQAQENNFKQMAKEKVKIDKKVIAAAVLLGIALLLFLSSNIFMPLFKKNKELAQELKEKKEKFAAIQRVSEKSFSFTQARNDLRALDAFLSEEIPAEPLNLKLNKLLVEPVGNLQITVTYLDCNTVLPAVFPSPQLETEIAYQVIPVRMGVRSDLLNLIKLLAWLKSQSRYISIQGLSIIPDREGNGLINTSLSLSAYAQNPAAVPNSPGGKGFKFGQEPWEKISAMPQSKKIDLSHYNIVDPFAVKKAVSLAVTPTEAIPLTLSGIIFKAGKGKSIAIINNKLLKEGDAVEGNKIIRIEQDKVILETEGKQFILAIKKAKKGA